MIQIVVDQKKYFSLHIQLVYNRVGTAIKNQYGYCGTSQNNNFLYGYCGTNNNF